MVCGPYDYGVHDVRLSTRRKTGTRDREFVHTDKRVGTWRMVDPPWTSNSPPIHLALRFFFPTGQGQKDADGSGSSLPADFESIQRRLAAIESMLRVQGDSDSEHAGAGEASKEAKHEPVQI